MVDPEATLPPLRMDRHPIIAVVPPPAPPPTAGPGPGASGPETPCARPAGSPAASRWGWGALLLAALVAVPPGGGRALLAQTTTYVSADDPAYEDLEVLAAAGWITSAPLVSRTHARSAFARFAAEARQAAAAEARDAPARLLEALARLEARFGPDACGGAACAGAPAAAARLFMAEFTVADSPPRPVPTAYRPDPAIDADVNPLLQRNLGRVLEDGATAAAEAAFDLAPTSFVAARIHPRAWWGSEGGADATLVEGYLRLKAANLTLDVGRRTVPRGHASDGGVAVSDNARGMDMIRLALERPIRLPWLLSALGPLSASAYVADMGAARDRPHSKLIVFEIDARPHPRLELGTILMNHQGGGVEPDATLTDRLLDIFLIFPQRRELSDKVIGFDARFTVPAQRLALYVDFVTTDDHTLFTKSRQSVWEEAVWAVGLRRYAMGPSGRWDAWGEARHAGVRPHTHHQFTSGLTLDRRVIGDPLGPLAAGVTLGLARRGATTETELTVSAERYAGDRWTDPAGDGRILWVKIEDNPDEIRLRGDVTLAWRPRPTGITGRLRLGVERARRFAFTGPDRTNVRAQLRLGYRW